MMPLLAQLEMHWSQWATPFTVQWWEETTTSVLVGLSCGVLGCFVVLRRMALIGDALSHAVLPGVVIAFMVWGTGIGGLLLGALLAGLLTAVLINLVGRFSRAKEDSAIGMVFTALFALGIVLISNQPRGTHFDLQCFLFGDPLAVGRPDLIMMCVVAPLVVLIVTLLYHPLKLASFDPTVAAAMGISVAGLHYLLMGMLSATVVAGLKATGVVLVVAMLITPASAAYQLTNRLSVMLLLSALFGAISGAAGMSLAFITNAPTGPAMVLVATFLFVLAMLGSPSHGVLAQAVRRWRVRRHVETEDVLKYVYKLGERSVRCTVDQVVEQTHLARARVDAVVSRLVRDGVLVLADGMVTLTDAGKRRAVEMVRAHRLWESYLTSEAGLDPEAVHDEAERLEHAHELSEEVADALGHPERDPHRSVIPNP